MALNRFETHSHTHYSNLRLLDCINRPELLIKRAMDIGLKGIAVTDHECVSGHMEINILAQEILKEKPDFKIALGNEIYLTLNRSMGQRYYHFILIAKNAMGQKALRELSSEAWLHSYYDRRLERVPTLYSELENITKKYPNSLIATSACLGGEVSVMAKQLIEAEKSGDLESAEKAHNDIVNFILFCKKIFGEDFYIECAPGCSNDQIIVNKRLRSIAKAFNLKMVIGTDAHYLKKEDRFIHKSYLNSKDGDREVDDFYSYTYLQEEKEIFEHLRESDYEDEFIKEMFENSMEIWDKIENYDLRHKQTIPKVEVKDIPKNTDNSLKEKYPILNEMMQSDDKVERYWVNECIKNLKEKKLDKPEYYERLEEEADIKKTVGEKLETNMFAYPVTLQHYVNMFWDCGSMVGAGRGSSCSGLNHYLLGVTQLDPIQWNLPFWRYLNKERLELGDIDLDLCPSKRPIILQKIKAERGQNFKSDISEITKKNCGATLIATFGTEGTRSTILAACRGYRSEDFKDGIDADTAKYLSSLIPEERGFLWSLSDVVYGNEEKNRKPNAFFINEVKKYPGLLDIMMGIQGLINKRSSHASGVIMFDEDPYEFGCFMKTPNGEVITQYDLHMCEAAGLTKYDFLVTEVQDKLTECISLFQEYDIIPKELSLKEVYDEYFHPEVLNLQDEKCWDALNNNSVLNVFQFDSNVGSQAAKKIKPRTILEMSDANGLMRLMTSEKGEETPMEKYIRYKNNLDLWYQEMDSYGLTKEEQKTVEPYFKQSYGVPPSQEQLMKMLMDEDICDFTLKEANTARKIVGKKQMNKIPNLRNKVLEQAKSPCLGNYIWKCGVGPQMGYSFSLIHALAYSFIGYQTLSIATNWNPIYWNTACLIVNSGSLEDSSEEEIVDIYEQEGEDLQAGVTFQDLPNGKEKIRKTISTDYAKMAKAIGETISKGIQVSTVDINKSNFRFKPDAENNQILFGLKGLTDVGDDVIRQIIDNRPYTGICDFMNRCPINKRAMISLIKAGAFDDTDAYWARQICSEPRIGIMIYYLHLVSSPKKKVTMQNLQSLIEKGLLPRQFQFEEKVFYFNKYLKTFCKYKNCYAFDERAITFYQKHFNEDFLQYAEEKILIEQTLWDKKYQDIMSPVRQWIIDNQEEALEQLNKIGLYEMWSKYAKGNISSWEMDSMCFYHHKHELADVDIDKYGVVNFDDLSEEPEIERLYTIKGRHIPIYKLSRIIGTVISKNNSKSSVALLTTNGVVNVKFTKDHYAMFNRRISEVQKDGQKKVKEEGWFSRGTKLLLTGFRRGDTFQTKSYKDTLSHKIYKITNVSSDRKDIEITHLRYGQVG